MRILGIPFWPEKISDEQYVERTRKGLRMMRRLRFIFVLGYLGLFIGFILLIFQAVHLLGDLTSNGTAKHHPTDSSQQQIVYSMYYLAVVMGAFVGLLLGNTISHIATILLTYRKDKLLVEFWDALSDAEKARLRQMSS